ncbi:Putative glycosyltransferase EpsD [Thalassovita gelatinovora]|uniref:Putative glycosyltransferase EpsD n=1 Tax=Thalassovita gelatinovora TaxID=53501 RepID=A0A0P1FYT8_THAGE|nr:exopolysaccharide biosynthesis GT4 family glycosyltransferase EpsE [Thalassovita gelatinovora]QIZ81266.1 glycosyltransferase family 4 protein [Thalassovita gelatinovora]CUH64606.1 Putative glycosyltransferase EpsD [Thalassovita gelatinovora]SEP95118.1 Glycosyltransferase involved in cell wall bisynthesis [Thalassovita gelatinovora]
MPKITKLGYLVPQFPGQTHIFFWREIQKIEEAGVDVCLFSTRPPPPGLVSHAWSQSAMERTEYLASASISSLLAGLPRLPLRELLREGAGKDFWRDVLISLPAARKLAQHCRVQGISHVHVHSCGRAAMIAALAQRLYGVSYSISLHGPLEDYGPGQRFKWRSAKFATVITDALVQDIRPKLGDALPDRVVIQPMGVDTDRLHRTTPYQPPQPGETLRLFTCARLHLVKGHVDALQAVRLLLDRGMDVRLEIAGEDDAGGGGFHTVLAEKIQDLGLQDHVMLLGAVPEETVCAKLFEAHLFVLASWSEPLGVAYMEAMSCEVPVIGTDAGGVRELITDGQDGILVQPKAPETLADTIAALAADPQKCLGLSAAGRWTVVDRFGAGRGADTLIQEATRN